MNSYFLKIFSLRKFRGIKYLDNFMCVHFLEIAHCRHRPGPEWGTWGDPQGLNWFLPLIKPLRRMRTLWDPAQTQVWSKQVWLDTTFISQGSQLWGKLAVETWRLKTELIIITILHINTTATSILNLGFKKLRQKYCRMQKCINKNWKYTQISAAQKIKQNHKILVLAQNLGASWKFRRNLKI